MPSEEPGEDKLETLANAVQAVAHVEDPGSIVTQSLVIWEALSYDEDGKAATRISYVLPGSTFSLASSLGLLEAGKQIVLSDCYPGCRSGEDE